MKVGNGSFGGFGGRGGERPNGLITQLSSVVRALSGDCYISFSISIGILACIIHEVRRKSPQPGPRKQIGNLPQLQSVF